VNREDGLLDVGNDSSGFLESLLFDLTLGEEGVIVETAHFILRAEHHPSHQPGTTRRQAPRD